MEGLYCFYTVADLKQIYWWICVTGCPENLKWKHTNGEHSQSKWPQNITTIVAVFKKCIYVSNVSSNLKYHKHVQMIWRLLKAISCGLWIISPNIYTNTFLTGLPVDCSDSSGEGFSLCPQSICIRTSWINLLCHICTYDWTGSISVDNLPPSGCESVVKYNTLYLVKCDALWNYIYLLSCTLKSSGVSWCNKAPNGFSDPEHDWLIASVARLQHHGMPQQYWWWHHIKE